MPQFTSLPGLKEKIRDFGKENLDEMLHALATGIMETAPECTVRIYLEDLTKGALSCAYASGPNQAAIRGDNLSDYRRRHSCFQYSSRSCLLKSTLPAG